MDKKRVFIVFGTRPEAIKMIPVVKAFRQCECIQTIVAVTAQHREMLDQVLSLYDVVPDIDLDIMRQGQTLGDITSHVLQGIGQALRETKPDLVLVHGDTSTTMAAALAAFYEKIPVGHVEAGLRTYDKYSPYPEEINRRIVSAIADLNFAPTARNRQNLIAERVPENSIFVTGNTVIDALLMTVRKDYVFEQDALNHIDYDKKRVILVTCHRRENWGEPMRNIFLAIRDIAQMYGDAEVVFPVHKNPLVRETSREILGNVPNIRLIEPLEYEAFSCLMAKSYLVMTDSGGIQEEAPSLKKPVLVLRTTTERPEAVEAGTVRLVGVDRENIVRECAALLDHATNAEKMRSAANPYGDGHAAQRILSAVLQRFGLS